jgi:hypothetical protein
MPFAGKPKRFQGPTPRRRPLPTAASLARVLLLAAFVAMATGWAVLRHYAKPSSMLNPAAPRTAPTYDEDAGEMPVPEWTEQDAS